MKRRPLLLAVPLMLLALVLGVKWRADHPTPTKEDLRIRALMSKSYAVKVTFFDNVNDIFISKQDTKDFVDFFYISPDQNSTIYISGSLAILDFYIKNPKSSDIADVSATIDTVSYIGTMGVRSSGESAYTIHSLTAKRWKELLLAHPRTGPELRKRMNN